MSQNVPGSPVLKFSSKRNETLLRMLHTEICTRHLCKICGPTHKVNELNGHQNAWTRAEVNISMEKNEKTSVSNAL